MTEHQKEGVAGFSFKALLITAIGILLFGIYVGILMYGENSLTVLNQLKDKKENYRKKGTQGIKIKDFKKSSLS